MATRQPTPSDGQTQLGDFAPGVYEFGLGNLLEVTQHGTSSPKIRLTECPFCSKDWHDAYRRGEHTLHAVEEHLQARHARPVESKRDDEHHSFSRGDAE